MARRELTRESITPPPPPTTVDRRVTLARIENWLSGSATASLSGNGAVLELERRFTEMIGRRFAVAVSSGTAAIELALRGLRVQAGDRVLVPAYDWPAATAVVLALGAQPIPVDVDLRSGSLSPEALLQAVQRTQRPRAVIVTHLGGRPANIVALKAVTDSVGIPLIEDCAQALGSMVGQKAVGSYGVVATFSLGPRKLVSSGEGGVLVTDDDELYERVVGMGLHPLAQRLRGVRPNPLHLNARIHPVAPLLALPALDELPSRLPRIVANARCWTDLFQSQPGFALPALPEGAKPGWWDFVVRCDETAWELSTRDVLRRLQRTGIPISQGPIPWTIGAILRDSQGIPNPPCLHAESWCATALQVPLSDAASPEFVSFVERVGQAIRKVYDNRRRMSW